jgi:hypothetical protein
MIAPYNDDSSLCCSRCSSPVPVDLLGASTTLVCKTCGAPLQVEVFPAMIRGIGPVEFGESLHTEDEASCFYHSGKRAVTVCANCGRFLCALCDMPLADQRLCPNCVQEARKQGQIPVLVKHRVLHDRVILSLAIIPLLVFWLTIITAPVTLYLALRRWKSPSSLVRKSRPRFVAAIMIAGAQLAGWTTFLVYRLG